jgi:hypothetical protein
MKAADERVLDPAAIEDWLLNLPLPHEMRNHFLTTPQDGNRVVSTAVRGARNTGFGMLEDSQ